MIDPHACPPVIHPSTLIADILLQKHPDAKVAIVHDDHWGILVRQHLIERRQNADRRCTVETR
jgi:hypothetical protein